MVKVVPHRRKSLCVWAFSDGAKQNHQGPPNTVMAANDYFINYHMIVETALDSHTT